MKKHIIIFCLLSILCNIAFANKPDLMAEMTENYLLIRQKPGTEHLLKEYLKYLKLKSDTIYAILYAPMNCPRCEACIRPFLKLLKENNTNNASLIISIYPDSISAQNNNKKVNI